MRLEQSATLPSLQMRIEQSLPATSPFLERHHSERGKAGQPMDDDAIKEIDERDASAEQPGAVRKRVRGKEVGIVRTWAIDEYLVVFPPWVVGKDGHLSAGKLFAQSVNAVEPGPRSAALAQKGEVGCDAEFVHLLHADDVDRTVDLVGDTFGVLR